MKYFVVFFVAFAFIRPFLGAQPTYSLSVEKIVAKPDVLVKLQKDRLYFPSGQNGKTLVYQMNHKGISSSGYSSEAIIKVYYDEATKKIMDSVDLREWPKKILRINQVNDLTLFHGFFKVPSQFENKLIDELDRGEFLQDYQDIWLEEDTKEVKIKSYSDHYYDKDIEFSIDNSGRYVLISTFVSTYLRSTEADSVITIFDISKIYKKGRDIYCVECIKPQIVGNYIYYGKKFFYLKGADVYDWKIYRAPLFDLSKSELIGEYIELISVTPDNKFILGKKLLYGKETFLILDVKSKKFQYILGRDYTMYKLFYSPAFQKFAFDREDHIIYIEYPKQFPFGSLGLDVKPKRKSATDDITFWQKFMHSPR